MHGPYPGELRVRVIRFVEGGGSRREAAEQFDVSVSSAIRWVQRFRDDGTCEPIPRGGVLRHWRSTRSGFSPSSVSSRTSRWVRLFRRCTSGDLPGSRSALSRFFARHGITVKKKSAGSRAQASRRGSGAPTLGPRARHA